MKAKISYDHTKFVDKDKNIVHKFIKFLQSHYPLKDNITIKFMGKRAGHMTSGSRTDNSVLKILADNRMNRDIFRTLAHEWVHEYQRKVLKRPHGPNIGGKNEDEANAFAGRLMKMFEKEYPNLEEKMYESKTIENKLKILTEQILLSEKEPIKENLISEMKKIGIDKLPYSYSSLQKFIDSKTMDVHYNKHYKGYVDKLNKLLKDKDGDMELEEIVKSISRFDNKVRNNAGGAFNHALFWKMLSPKKQIPKGEIYKQIKKDFGNIKKMKDEFNEAAKDRFGSGWAWLYLTKDGSLKIMSLPNQDNPLMNVIKKGGFPLLGLDVWEHAYYLKYQNKRDEYISNFWNVVNWEFVEELYLSKTKKEKTKIIKESQTLNEDNVVEFTYATLQPYVKVIQNATIKRFFFNDIKLVNGDQKTASKVLLKGDNGEFEFDIKKNKVTFKVNEDGTKKASISQKTMYEVYPNFTLSKKNIVVNGAGITNENVLKALKMAFPNNWHEEDAVFTPGLRDIYTIGSKVNDDSETWSIMNFFDTKDEVKEKIYEKYKEDVNSGVEVVNIVDWMTDLFTNRLDFLKQLIERQWQSVKTGFDLERETTKYLTNKFQSKNVITYPYGSKMDRWYGVDVTIDGINYQVKPLSRYSVEKDGTEFVVYTYGMKNYKNYKKIDRLVFANNQQILIFDNKNYDVPSKSVAKFKEEPIIFQK